MTTALGAQRLLGHCQQHPSLLRGAVWVLGAVSRGRDLWAAMTTLGVSAVPPGAAAWGRASDLTPGT